jgi:hypothetical protein
MADGFNPDFFERAVSSTRRGMSREEAVVAGVLAAAASAAGLAWLYYRHVRDAKLV